MKGESTMNPTVRDLINEQINKELYSAYLYLDLANYYHYFWKNRLNMR